MPIYKPKMILIKFMVITGFRFPNFTTINQEANTELRLVYVKPKFRKG